MGKKIYKIANPLTGLYDSPSLYANPKTGRPFAIIQESFGYKGMRQVGEVRDPAELMDFKLDNGMGIPSPFVLVKRRLVKAVREWMDKGWITRDDLAAEGLEPLETRADGLGPFPTTLRTHTVKRQVERTREKFEL